MGNDIFRCASRLRFRVTFIQYYICFFETPANIDFAGYADDNTLYTYFSNIENVLDNLQGALKKCCIGFQQITWQQMQENVTF